MIQFLKSGKKIIQKKDLVFVALGYNTKFFFRLFIIHSTCKMKELLLMLLLLLNGNLRDTFASNLSAPSCDSVLSHIRLVIFIQWQTTELSIDDRFRFSKVITRWIDSSNHGGTSTLHGAVDLLDSITKVVTIGGRVSATKDGNLLAREIQVSNLFKNLIPSGSTSSFIGTSVPCWCTNNEGIVLSQITDVDLTNISRIGNITRKLLLNPIGSSLSVTYFVLSSKEMSAKINNAHTFTFTRTHPLAHAHTPPEYTIERKALKQTTTSFHLSLSLSVSLSFSLSLPHTHTHSLSYTLIRFSPR